MVNTQRESEFETEWRMNAAPNGRGITTAVQSEARPFTCSWAKGATKFEMLDRLRPALDLCFHELH